MKSHDVFREFTHSTRWGDALHLGTLRSNPEVSTLDQGKSYFPDGWAHQGTDLAPGTDVDIVADLHEISRIYQSPPYDAIVALSVFEHLAEPWVVTEQLAKIIRPGGMIFVQTHQTFPIHAYPDDYWRFTAKALEVLFSFGRGWKCLAAEYEFPCHIVSDEAGIQSNAYLNVVCTAQRL